MAKKHNNPDSAHIKIGEYTREGEKEVSQKEEEINIEIPEQPEFFKTPIRFGNIPVDTLPLGCDQKEQYRKIYPKISLPFQVVERVSFGHKDLEPNQLIFGDNLHVMRALPSNSIDLIYLDPPFFSGRNYNVVFGDQNEIRSFTDIWEGGMPGYLIWLNARLLEMKRLLKPNGSILVHCDWHASHYIKIELDKIFEYDNFRNEIVWRYRRWPAKQKNLQRMHDSILWYSKSNDGKHNFKVLYEPLSESTLKADGGLKILNVFDEGGNRIRGKKTGEKSPGAPMSDVWEISLMAPTAKERIGYPTQKPEALMERILETLTNPNDVVADFFCGGGTTAKVAQELNRRWIACDISKIAVSVTRDRILKFIMGKNGESKGDEQVQQSIGTVPDMVITHWGVYEVPEIVKMNEGNFRTFIISAYNGRLTKIGRAHV